MKTDGTKLRHPLVVTGNKTFNYINKKITIILERLNPSPPPQYHTKSNKE